MWDATSFVCSSLVKVQIAVCVFQENNKAGSFFLLKLFCLGQWGVAGTETLCRERAKGCSETSMRFFLWYKLLSRLGQSQEEYILLIFSFLVNLGWMNLHLEAVQQLKKAFEDLEVAQKFSAFFQMQQYSVSFLLIVQMLHIKNIAIFYSLSFYISEMSTMQISFILPNSILISLNPEFTEKLIKIISFLWVEEIFSKITSGKALIKSSREFLQNDQFYVHIVRGRFPIASHWKPHFYCSIANTTTVV